MYSSGNRARARRTSERLSIRDREPVSPALGTSNFVTSFVHLSLSFSRSRSLFLSRVAIFYSNRKREREEKEKARDILGRSSPKSAREHPDDRIDITRRVRRRTDRRRRSSPSWKSRNGDIKRALRDEFNFTSRGLAHNRPCSSRELELVRHKQKEKKSRNERRKGLRFSVSYLTGACAR